MNQFSRTELLLGKEAMETLKKCSVAVFGVGGVGSFTVEGLARCGIGKITLIDNDDVCISNVNRQLHATTKTVGKSKVELMKQRVLDINPKAQVIALQKFYSSETAHELLDTKYDYVVDAIDTISAKIDLVVRCKNMNIPIVSSMGAGNKLNPTGFKVADIYETSIDPIAKVMRKELRNRNIKSLKVVYSTEEPKKTMGIQKGFHEESDINPPDSTSIKIAKRQVPGSISFVPSVVGLILAGEVVKDLIHDKI